MKTLDDRVRENFKKDSFWSNVKAVANLYGTSAGIVGSKIAYDADLPELIPAGLIVTGYFLYQTIKNWRKAGKAKKFIREFDEREASMYIANPFAQE